MAEAVNGTHVPISQTIPDPTRRALLSAIPAAAIGAAALAPAARAFRAPPIEAEASDALFLKWEAEWTRYQEAFAVRGKTDEEIEQLADEQTVFERLIFETPSASRTAAEVKARLLGSYVRESMMDDLVAPLEHILVALKAA